MSLAIRLQNLPWSANAADIRQYFQGLSIPEGGVHIVGGEKRMAFISFSTDNDARQAMFSDGGCIKDVQIRLSLSSRKEMRKVIETAKQQTTTQVYMHQMQQPQHQRNIDNHQTPVMDVGPPGNVGFNHIRIPPQPPIGPVLAANFYQQHPRYGGGGGRPSRFRWIQGGSGGKPPRFNPMLQQRGKDNGGGDGSESKDPKRAAAPARFNNRYRFDVRYAQTPRVEGLCVELNNMPSNFSYGDVRKLFEGIHIDGSAIKIQEHRLGVAFVRFNNNRKKNLALRMNGNAYKGNNVAVKHLDDETYERKDADDRPYATTSAATAGVVDLVDDEEDNGGGQPSAKKRKNEEDSNDPVTCDKKPSATEGGGGDEGEGQRSPATLQQQQQQQQPQKPLQQQQQNAPTKYLILTQLPSTVTKEDVLNGMAGNDQVRRVTIYPDGEFMGAVLEFRSAEEAEATLKLSDCVLLGCTPVPVLRCTYKEYVQLVRKSGGGTKRFPGESTSGHNKHQHHVQAPVPPQPTIQPNVAPTGSRSDCVHVLGLPTSVTYTDIAQFFAADTSVLPDKIHIMLGRFGRPTGEAYCEFSTVQQAHTALIKHQCYMGPSLVHVSPINRSDMVEAIAKAVQQRDHRREVSWAPGGGSGNRDRGSVDGPKQRNMMSGPKQQHQVGFEQSGCMVALDNVPYGADVQEIVNFFSGFELNSRNVVMRLNDSGKPTGEVLVGLGNPQEAMRAVRVLQNKFIFNRPVRLALL